METTTLGLLFQAGMVGAFIFYALSRDRREAAERKDRDASWRDFLREQTEANKEALDDRDKALAEFLGAERAQRKDAIDTGTGYVHELANAIGELTAALQSHEGLAEKRHARTLAAIRSLAKAGMPAGRRRR